MLTSLKDRTLEALCMGKNLVAVKVEQRDSLEARGKMSYFECLNVFVDWVVRFFTC